MKKPTEILSDEHKTILTAINTLAEKCNGLESGNTLDKTFFLELVYFIRNYADKFHHAKEEDILFVEMRKSAAGLHCNPVDQMLYEHEAGRVFVRGIERSIGRGSVAGVATNSAGYAKLLQEHIFKEDNILYPMADGILDKNAQARMLVKFADADRKSGKGVMERCVSFAMGPEKARAKGDMCAIA